MVQCKSATDRRGDCYRCGQKGHLAAGCVNAVACGICRDGGRNFQHSVGSTEHCRTLTTSGDNRENGSVCDTQEEVEVEETARRTVNMTSGI